jgi:hypothetical protein
MASVMSPAILSVLATALAMATAPLLQQWRQPRFLLTALERRIQLYHPQQAIMPTVTATAMESAMSLAILSAQAVKMAAATDPVTAAAITAGTDAAADVIASKPANALKKHGAPLYGAMLFYFPGSSSLL